VNRNPIDLSSISRSLSMSAVFTGLSIVELSELSWAAKSFKAAAGEVIYRQGDPANAIYFIEQGRVQLSVPTLGGVQAPEVELGIGDTIGEMALLDPSPRLTTAVAIERSGGVQIPRYAFEVLRTSFTPGAVKTFKRLAAIAAARVRAIISARVAVLDQSDLHDVDKQLSGVFNLPVMSVDVEKLRAPTDQLNRESLLALPGFRRFSREEIDELLGHMHLIEVQRGASVFREGDPAGSCFVTVRGAVLSEIERDGEIHKIELAGPGRMFGHLELLDPSPRSTNCVAREPSILLELERSTFDELFASSSPVVFRFLDGVVELLTATIRQALRRSAWEAALAILPASGSADLTGGVESAPGGAQPQAKVS
jgi:CRP-like cAMP-binding protein